MTKTVFLVLRSWSPKLAKNFASCGMLIRPVQVDALPGQPTTPADVANHLYKHSQIPTPPPVTGKPHKQMLATPLYNKCTLHTPLPFLFLCLFHLRATPSLPIIRAKLLQPSPWLYTLTQLFPLELTLFSLQSQFRSAAPRYPGTIVQTPNMRTMGPPPRGTRAPYNASRK